MRVLAVLGVVVCTACGSTTRNPVGGEAGSTAWGGAAGAGGTVNEAGASGAGDSSDLVVPTTSMRRLTTYEYAATISDVLGVDAARPNLSQSEQAGFDTVAAVQHVSAPDIDVLLGSAERVAQQVFANASLRSRWPACSASQPGCVASFVESAALRLFRRPALEGELEAFGVVYDEAKARGADHDHALELTLVALLTSSQFVYRMELLGDAGGIQPLDSFAVATRLSYLLWGSAPDDALLTAAAADELQTDDGVSAAFQRLLADPRARRFVENFSGQWLGFRRIATHTVDYTKFDWREGLASELTAEGYDYFEGFLREPRPWQAFFSVDIPAPGPFRAQLYTPDGEKRRGYLSLPGFLATTSLDRRTSPTLRGNFIRRVLLCDPLPPPPADVPVIEDVPRPMGLRSQVEYISRDPRCAECHKIIDPLGLALEHYDFVGQYRTKYADDGIVVDSAVAVEPSTTYPQGLELKGLDDVSAYVASEPKLMTCLVNNLYVYGLGRVPDDTDERNPELLAEQWQSGASTLSNALSTLVQSKPFRYGNPGGTP